MTIEINESRILKIETTYNDVAELAKIEEFYYSVLCKMFLEQSAVIITIAPQKNLSIGYDISPFREVNIGTEGFLINEVTSCSSSILKEISSSEEFQRGLIVIVVNHKIISINVDKVLRCIHYKLGFENLSYELVRCESDGSDLYIYNTQLTKNSLTSIVPKT